MRARNRVYLRIRRSKYGARTREHLLEWQREYDERHREYINEQRREYRERHREYFNWQVRRHREKMKGIPSPRNGTRWTRAEDAIVMRDDLSLTEMCYMLGRSYDSVSYRRQFLKYRKRAA
jgi:hypothetical protein